MARMLVETIRGATLYVERWPCFVAFSNSSLKLSFLFHKRSRQISRLDRSYRALEERKKLHKIIKEKWNRVKKYRDRIRMRVRMHDNRPWKWTSILSKGKGRVTKIIGVENGMDAGILFEPVVKGAEGQERGRRPSIVDRERIVR